MVLAYHGSAPFPKVSTDGLVRCLCSRMAEGLAVDPNDDNEPDFSDVAIVARIRDKIYGRIRIPDIRCLFCPEPGVCISGWLRAEESLPGSVFLAKL